MFLLVWSVMFVLVSTPHVIRPFLIFVLIKKSYARIEIHQAKPRKVGGV